MLRLAGLTAEIHSAGVPLSTAAGAALAHAPGLVNRILCGGDDYEILCAVPPAEKADFSLAAEAAGIKVQDIGICASGDDPIRIIGAGGDLLAFEAGSFQHF